MNFLIDMNLPRSLARSLTGKGHQCRHAGDSGLGKAADRTIIEAARRNGEVIITHDLDYGHELAFSGEPSPSVIILRVRNVDPANIFARVANTLPNVEEPLKHCAIVVIEDALVRVRKLPIRRAE